METLCLKLRFATSYFLVLHRWTLNFVNCTLLLYSHSVHSSLDQNDHMTVNIFLCFVIVLFWLISASGKSNRHRQIKEVDWQSQPAVWRYANSIYLAVSDGAVCQLVYVRLQGQTCVHSGTMCWETTSVLRPFVFFWNLSLYISVSETLSSDRPFFTATFVGLFGWTWRRGPVYRVNDALWIMKGSSVQGKWCSLWIVKGSSVQDK